VSRPLFRCGFFRFRSPTNGELFASGSCDPAGRTLKAPLNLRMLARFLSMLRAYLCTIEPTVPILLVSLQVEQADCR
jgi:hypothetical protein